jgi:hypothetical protein
MAWLAAVEAGDYLGWCAMERRFAINVGFFTFASAVEHLVGGREFQTDVGTMRLHPTRRMGDTYVLELRDLPSVQQASITFEALPLGERRTAVTATCRVERCEGVFRTVLAEIEELFPEVGGTGGPGAQVEAKREAQPREPRGMNIATAERVARARLYIERDGVTKTVGCDLAGLSLKTFNKWQDDPAVLKRLEELRALPPEEV